MAAPMAAHGIPARREVAAMLKHGYISDQPLALSGSPSSSPSPPPSYPKKVGCPTLQEMMSQEPWSSEKPLEADEIAQLRERVARMMAQIPVPGAGDVQLTVSSGDGVRVSLDVHRSVLSDKSRFFREKLGEKIPHLVEICECDDVEVYVETVLLMYCHDLRKRLGREEVRKVLELLKVSAAIMFDDGIASCLEYLEAVPWSKDDEEKVVSALGKLQLPLPVKEVLQRVSVEPCTSASANDIFVHLLTGVLQAKDEKARREMKNLISKLLKEDLSKNDDSVTKLDVSRDTLYPLCHKCLSSLLLCLSEAANVDENMRDRGALMAEVAREADNMQWIADIMIEKKMGEEFLVLWADQRELSNLHSKIPAMYRYEISGITARLCIAVGRGHILVPKDCRFSLLQTWLEALYDDFGWMKRACRSVDTNLVEEGLSQTILTLPMAQQQAILLNWFDRFLNKGNDCPNIQRAFEVWWRRTFLRQRGADHDRSEMQLTVCDYPT